MVPADKDNGEYYFMGKSQPERYNPGDLDRTRSNLGELSREEAERMSSILGGEIGIEKTDEALQQKYDRP